MLISSRMQKVLACNGVALSVIEIQEIANARAQAIRDVGGIELNAEGLLGYVAVSYTHLDVYKRQALCGCALCFSL